MNTLSQLLPAGLSPEPTPALAGPAPAPGDQSAPGVCVYCEEHHLRIGTVHFRESEKGMVRLGLCAAPPAPPAKREAEAEKRSHTECVARIRDLADRSSVSRVLAEARGTFATHSVVEDD